MFDKDKTLFPIFLCYRFKRKSLIKNDEEFREFENKYIIYISMKINFWHSPINYIMENVVSLKNS